ncbi:response regulator [Microbacterium sp. P06]|uniref:response regulator transcription factor n=1 Tax=unclassified Microbacterium TaxID=2609290 RepID=UPI0037467B62
MIRVLLVDDQVAVRRGLREMLNAEPDITVAGEVASGPAALEISKRRHFDVALMDVRMPGGDGISASRILAKRQPPLPTVMMTSFDIDDALFRSLQAGVSGYVLKTGPLEELITAIRAASRGDLVISATVARRVVDHVTYRTSDVRPMDDAVRLLSRREIEVVRLLCSDTSTNEAIAGQLGLSPTTVKSHIQRISAKVGVNTRATLVAWAFRNGIVS